MIAWQCSQVQGQIVGLADSRRSDAVQRPAMMRAVVVLPTPRTPVSIKAWAMRPDA
jgi:hypothetical protein